MPRKLTVHFECERCPRTWLEDYKEGEPLPEAPSFKATLKAPQQPTIEVDFECLCDSCFGTVSNYFESITKAQKKSPKRGGKKRAQTESEPEGIEVTID